MRPSAVGRANVARVSQVLSHAALGCRLSRAVRAEAGRFKRCGGQVRLNARELVATGVGRVDRVDESGEKRR